MGFVVANVVALGLVLVAVVQPWVAGVSDVAVDLAILWLPAALATATALAAAIGLHLEPDARTGFFARHLALYLTAPLILLGMRSLFIPDMELG